MLNMTSKKNTARAAVVAALVLCGAASARADVVLDWNATMLAALAGQSPFASARYAAIMHLAVFEAVNAVTGDYEPYWTSSRRPPVRQPKPPRPPRHTPSC